MMEGKFEEEVDLSDDDLSFFEYDPEEKIKSSAISVHNKLDENKTEPLNILAIQLDVFKDEVINQWKNHTWGILRTEIEKEKRFDHLAVTMHEFSEYKNYVETEMKFKGEKTITEEYLQKNYERAKAILKIIDEKGNAQYMDFARKADGKVAKLKENCKNPTREWSDRCMLINYDLKGDNGISSVFNSETISAELELEDNYELAKNELGVNPNVQRKQLASDFNVINELMQRTLIEASIQVEKNMMNIAILDDRFEIIKGDITNQLGYHDYLALYKMHEEQGENLAILHRQEGRSEKVKESDDRDLI
jgi:hypothetical protein